MKKIFFLLICSCEKKKSACYVIDCLLNISRLLAVKQATGNVEERANYLRKLFYPECENSQWFAKKKNNINGLSKYFIINDDFIFKKKEKKIEILSEMKCLTFYRD